MKHTLEIGPTPAEEPCAQVGEPMYEERAVPECERFIKLLRKTFGREPEGAHLRVKGNNHDYGQYFECVVVYDDEKPEAVEYAFKVESEAPVKWDDT